MKLIYTPQVGNRFQKMDKTTLKCILDYMDEVAALAITDQEEKH